jgi:O-antigen/teichoic acid export membrane protein
MSGLHLTHSRRLARNSLLSLGTSVAVLGLGVLLIPLMIREFGLELFGILTITWVLVANLAWLDLGLSRAAARYVARELAVGDSRAAAVWAWTAIGTQACFGALGAVAVWFATPFLVDALGVSPGVRDLGILSFHLFALALTIEFAIRSLVGVLEAGQRFGLANALAIFGSAGLYLVGIVIVLLGQDFRIILYAFFALRICSFFASLAAANTVVPLFRSFSAAELMTRRYLERVREMIRFGGWIALGLLLGPMLLYFDQWLIGVILTVATLTYYTVPFNLQSRLSVFPASMIRPLFPAFSALEATDQKDRIEHYYLRAHRYLFFALVPIFFVVFVWAREILHAWIGLSFAEHATETMQILALGFIFGLLAPLSGALLNGRPDIVTKLYIVELPLNIIAVVVLTREFGLPGAAWSFVLRCVFETGLLWLFVGRTISFSRESIAFARKLASQGVAVLASMGVAAVLLRGSRIDDPISVLLTIFVLAAYAVWVLRFMLDRQDRRFLMTLVRREQPHGA